MITTWQPRASSDWAASARLGADTAYDEGQMKIPPFLYYAAWVILFVAATACINIMGVTVTARMNKIFLCIQLTVLAVFVIGCLYFRKVEDSFADLI